MSSAQTNAANWWENDPIVQPAQPQPAGGNWWENDPIVVPAQAQGPSVVTDVAKAIPTGLARGTAELVGLPGTLGDLGRSAVNWGLSRGYEAVTGSPAPEGSFFSDVKMPDSVLSGASLRRGASKLSDGATDYQPQTIPGQYAGTVAEFAPGMVLGMGSAGQRAAQAVVPALASETAGQVFKDSPWEPYARAGAAIAGGLGTAAWQTPKGAQSVLADNVSGIAEADWNAARALQARGAEQGVSLTLGEALNQVTGGRAQNISRLERVVANSGDDAGQIMNDLYAARPGQVERAARSTFDDFGPAAANPDMVGPQASGAARAVVDATPEGQALGQAHWRAGPRVSPEQAGTTIQNELHGVHSGREGMRAALAEGDYAAARNAPATVPTNEGLRDVQGTATALNRREIPIILNQGERDATKAQWLADNNRSGRFQIVGDKATQFAQVDPKAVVQAIDDALATAKGAVRDGLTAAKRALMTPGGAVDDTVEGLHNSRVAISDLISQAKQAGARDTARQLEGVVSKLDEVLEAVPLYGQARQNFKAASEPLAPFDAARGPGRVVERDQFNKQFVMQPERVTDALSSASDARAFNQVATPAAREAMEGRLVTSVLDTMKGRGLDVSAAGIRTAIRKQEDLFAQFPAAKERLLDIAASRDALAKIEKTAIGYLAKKDRPTQKAIEALFPADPLPGSSQQTFEAIQALSSQKPAIANQLVRTYVEQVFNRTAKELTGGPNVNGGARFVTELMGNSEKAANMRAAIRGLKNGDDILPGFERLMETLEATRWRPATGSATAFNQEAQKERERPANAFLGCREMEPIGRVSSHQP